MHVLLIDGMNLAWKAMHAYDLSTSEGVNTSAIYGFMNQLVSVMSGKKMPVIVVWDGGYQARTVASENAVQKGIVKVAYKSNRGDRPHDDKTSTMDEQLKVIRTALSYTDVKQVRVENQEADDVIASYSQKLMGRSSIICLTCDHDYYQLLDKHFSLISRWKGEEKIITWDSFVKEHGIEPWQWVDVGALAGDVSDCIIGVPGCGLNTALEYIIKYKDVESLITAMEQKFDGIRAACPDLSTWDEINRLIELGGTRSGSPNYDCCYPGMPFSGVAMALETGEIKKIKKIELKFSMYQERIRLAFLLKKMDRYIPVPNVDLRPSFNSQAFIDFCEKYELKSLLVKMEAFDFL